LDVDGLDLGEVVVLVSRHVRASRTTDDVPDPAGALA
jgi:hypothetical protein